MGKIPWRRKWQPTPVFLPGEFHGQRSLAGYSPWGHKELDTTEQVILSCISKMLLINCKIFHHCLKDLSEIRTHLGFTVSPPPTTNLQIIFLDNLENGQIASEISHDASWYCCRRVNKPKPSTFTLPITIDVWDPEAFRNLSRSWRLSAAFTVSNTIPPAHVSLHHASAWCKAQPSAIRGLAIVHILQSSGSAPLPHIPVKLLPGPH